MGDTSFLALLLRLTISLGVVLLLMAGAARLVGRTPGGTSRRHGIEVVGRQALGRRSSAAVVRVGSRAFVLGITDANVQLLAEVDPAELAAPEETARPTPARPGGAFAQHLLDELRERTVRRGRP